MRLSHLLFRITLIASAALLALTVFAWIEAVRLPDYANYWEWRDGWHVGVRNAGTLDHPIWWDTYAFVGQFLDRGVPPTVPPDVLVDPDRLDLDTDEIRLLWPLILSFVAPLVWLGSRFLRKQEIRGFPVINRAISLDPTDPTA